MAMVDAGRHGTSKAHHRRHSLVWWVLAALSVCCISLWGASHARLAASQTQIDALGERLKALEGELRVAKAEKQKESRDLASAKKRISSLQSKALQYEAEAAKNREELSSLSRLREQAADAQHGAAEERGACERRAQAADAELANLRTSMEERRKVRPHTAGAQRSIRQAITNGSRLSEILRLLHPSGAPRHDPEAGRDGAHPARAGAANRVSESHGCLTGMGIKPQSPLIFRRSPRAFSWHKRPLRLPCCLRNAARGKLGRQRPR